jgi:hypothetical protein
VKIGFVFLAAYLFNGVLGRGPLQPLPSISHPFLASLGVEDLGPKTSESRCQLGLPSAETFAFTPNQLTFPVSHHEVRADGMGGGGCLHRPSPLAHGGCGPLIRPVVQLCGCS